MIESVTGISGIQPEGGPYAGIWRYPGQHR
jgi:hypothetical protein